MLFNLESIVLGLFFVLLWIALFVIFRRGTLQQSHLRIGVLLAFVVLFLFVFFIFSSQPVITLVGVIFPVIWTFVDSQLVQYKGSKRRAALILKANTGYCKEVSDSIKNEFEKRFLSARIKLEPPQSADREENVNELRTIFENVVKERPDAIVIVPPPNNSSLIPIALEAHQKGIQLITVDDEFPPHEFACKRLTPPIHIGTDFDKGGRIAAEAMLSRLKGKGKGNIVIISGPHSSQPSQIRKLAFIDQILRTEQGATIVGCRETNWNRYEACQQMTELLKMSLVIDGVFCCNDFIALGVVDALKDLKVQKDDPQYPIIIGFDGIEAIYQPIVDGDVYASIEVGTRVQGQYVVDKLVSIFEDKEYLFKHSRDAVLLTTPNSLTKEVIRSRQRFGHV